MAKVLIVDDEPDIILLLQVILNKKGFEVSKASDGREAYEMLVSEKVSPDLIISDVFMNGISGPELLKKLKDIPGLKDIPVLFLSAEGSKSEQKALRGMSAGFIEKPFEIENLYRVVDEALSSRSKK